MINLNLASGNWKPEGWFSVDLRPRDGVSLVMDLSAPFSLKSDSVHNIFCSHFLEHLSLKDGENFLLECHRILVPGGRIRISVPDFKLLVTQYLNNMWNVEDEIPLNDRSILQSLNQELFYPYVDPPEKSHNAQYDVELLYKVMTEVGFRNVEKSVFGNSKWSEFRVVGLDNRPKHSLFMEGIK